VANADVVCYEDNAFVSEYFIETWFVGIACRWYWSCRQRSQAVENSQLKLNKTMSPESQLTDRQISDLQKYLNYFQKFEISINVDNNKNIQRSIPKEKQ
jgi:hypothetical protein